MIPVSIVKMVVSEVTGISIDKLNDDTPIPMQHFSEIVERITIRTIRPILIENRTGMTIGDLAAGKKSH